MFELHEFRPKEFSSRTEFPVIFRTEIKFRYDFRPSPKNSPEIRTKLKRTRRISGFKKRSAEQYVVVLSGTS
jgi:hypothetical protein